MSDWHFSIRVILVLLCPVLLISSAGADGPVVYENDFNSGPASLRDWVIFQPDAGAVDVTGGELALMSTSVVAIGISRDLSTLGGAYSPVLSANPGLITWGFNVSNRDAQSDRNNGFAVAVAYSWSEGGSGNPPSPFTDQAVGYILWGGGLVGSELIFARFDRTAGGKHEILIQVPSELGLGTLPDKGSVRIDFEPSTDTWSLFMESGENYVDPLEVTQLRGTAVDGTYTHAPLPYLSLFGENLGNDYFDNLRISVVPEPPLLLLLALGLLAFISNQQSARRRIGQCARSVYGFWID